MLAVGFLRVRRYRAIEPDASQMRPAEIDGSPPPETAALERLMKMIPAEVISIFPAGLEYFSSDGGVLVWVGICFLILLCVRYFATKTKNEGPQWGAIAWSAVAYLIWLYTLGRPVEALVAVYPKLKALNQPNLGPILLLIWSAVVPYLYRGDPKS